MCADDGEIKVTFTITNRPPPFRFEELPALFASAMGCAPVEGEAAGGKGFLYTFPSSVPGKEVGEGLYAPDFESYGAHCERLAVSVSRAAEQIAASFSSAMQAAAESYLAAKLADESRRLQYRAMGLTDDQAARCEAVGAGPDVVRALMFDPADAARLRAFRLPNLPFGARARARRERKKRARRSS